MDKTRSRIIANPATFQIQRYLVNLLQARPGYMDVDGPAGLMKAVSGHLVAFMA